MLQQIREYFIPTAHAVTTSSFSNLFNPTNNGNGSVQGAWSLVVTIINIFLLIVGAIAFIYLVIYGLKYVTSGGDAAKATEARNGIVNAIIGIIVITLAFFIIRMATSFATNPAVPS